MKHNIIYSIFLGIALSLGGNAIAETFAQVRSSQNHMIQMKNSPIAISYRGNPLIEKGPPKAKLSVPVKNLKPNNTPMNTKTPDFFGVSAYSQNLKNNEDTKANSFPNNIFYFSQPPAATKPFDNGTVSIK